MLEKKHFKTRELSKIDAILGLLPKRHTTYNQAISEMVRDDYLAHDGKTYLSVSGLYCVSSKSLVLFNPAFVGHLDLGEIRMPLFDFTVLTLVGFSLFGHPEVKKYWASSFYPQFDRGDMANREFKMIERERIPQELSFKSGLLHMTHAKVSLDRSFALAYLSYIAAPGALLETYPPAYHFLRNTVFVGKEYRAQGTSRRNIRAVIRA